MGSGSPLRAARFDLDLSDAVQNSQTVRQFRMGTDDPTSRYGYSALPNYDETSQVCGPFLQRIGLV